MDTRWLDHLLYGRERVPVPQASLYVDHSDPYAPVMVAFGLSRM